MKGVFTITILSVSVVRVNVGCVSWAVEEVCCVEHVLQENAAVWRCPGPGSCTRPEGFEHFGRVALSPLEPSA